jgi:hypothetical protein
MVFGRRSESSGRGRCRLCASRSQSQSGKISLRLLQLLRRPLHLQQDVTVVLRNPGAPHVWHNIEQFAESPDDRFLNRVFPCVQLDIDNWHEDPLKWWALDANCDPGDQPPAIAGTMETESPSFNTVFSRSRKRISSSFT